MSNVRHCLILFICACLGCGTASSPPPTTSPQPLGPFENDSNSNAAAGPTDQSLASPDHGANDADNSLAASAVPPESPSPSERFLLFAPGGPLIVDLILLIDGQPHSAVMDRLIDDVLKAADANGDGHATWDELTSSPQFMYGQFGNMPIASYADRQQVVQNYDVIRNGRVDRSEVPRLLTRNSGSSRAFSLRSSQQYPGDNLDQSHVRRWLDVDADGVLSAAEIASAVQRLRSRDADDDERLVAADFQQSATPAMPEMPVRRYGPQSAQLLSPNPAWDSILFTLEELYSNRGQLGSDSFPRVPRLFECLDSDHDGELVKEEIAQLGEIEPHITLIANFGQSGESGVSAARLELKSLGSQLLAGQPRVSYSDQRISIELAGVEVEFLIHDPTAMTDFDAQAEMQLAAYDADQNGYLEENEIPPEASALGGSLAAIDSDGNGKVYAAEIAALLRRQQAAALSQIHAQAQYQEDALFIALDADGNGYLGAREIAGAAGRLQTFDRDGNGQLVVGEIPESMAVIIARGDPLQGDALFSRQVNLPNYAANLPRWFVHMDSNGDGDISQREFLGSLDQFEQLDSNNDHYIDSSEAIPAMLE
jgi:Ca2+-binding EF-hand superfamily protein